MAQQWMQCDFIQTLPVWADSACGLRDTHDGVDDHAIRRADEAQAKRDEDFRLDRERLRATIEAAMEDPDEPVSEEILAVAAPVIVPRTEEIDFERVTQLVLASIGRRLAELEASARRDREIEARIAQDIEDDDEEVLRTIH